MTENCLSESAIFKVAVSLSPDQRKAYLMQACGPDSDLRRDVEALLKAHETAGGFLRDSLDRPQAAIDCIPIAERPGTIIGPYKLLEQIGEGGMGIVFMAEQMHPIQRKVALKIIKPGMDTKQVIARFEAERQALALMDHPNIAKVFDAGTTESGRPYFVMELVRGIPLTEHCDQHKLTIRQRVELLVSVCQAVQHAHQKGVIHRDLKPGNVLITMHDGHPMVKVIDFGVAKATGQKLTEKTLFTGLLQMIGTPLYMSPEQAELSALDVDTRSDIYSLGVMLYELLTGTTPFDSQRLKEAAFDEIRRIIREEEPPRPSTRLSTLGEQDSSTFAEKRNIDPRQLRKLFQGELDWIVMKCLEKDRNRRYETASALSADLENYLSDEPVLACPPSRVYRLRKFARHYRGAIVTASLVVAALILGLAATAWQAIEATQAKKQSKVNEQLAQTNARRADAIADFLVNALRSPDPARDGRSVTIAEVLDRTTKEVEEEFADDKRMQADLLGAIAKSYEGLGLYRESVVLFAKVQELRSIAQGSIDPATIEAMCDSAAACERAGQPDKAIPLYEAVLKAQFAHFAPDAPEVLATTTRLAWDYNQTGQLEKAQTLFEDVLHKLIANFKHAEPAPLDIPSQELPEGGDRHQKTISLLIENTFEHIDDSGANRKNALVALNNIAKAFAEAGQVDQAIPLLQQTLKHMQEKLGADDPMTLTCMYNLAMAFKVAGRFDEAAPNFEEVLRRRREKLGPDDPVTVSTMTCVGANYGMAGKNDKCVELLGEVLRIRRAKLGDDHPETLWAMWQYGCTLCAADRDNEAMLLFQQALTRSLVNPGIKHPTTIGLIDQTSAVYVINGRFEERVALWEQVLSALHEKFGPNDPLALLATIELADAYDFVSRFDDAVKMGEEALRLLQAARGPDDPETLHAMNKLAGAYYFAERPADAVTLRKEHVELCRAKFGAEHFVTLDAMSKLANTYYEAGQQDEAVRLSKVTLNIQKEKLGAAHPSTLGTMNNLAVALRELGRCDEAIVIHEDLVARWRNTGDKRVGGALEQLAETYECAGRLDDALTLDEQSLQHHLSPRDPWTSRIITPLNRIACVLLIQDKAAEAEARVRECLAALRAALPADDPQLAHATNVLTFVLLRENKLAEAESTVRSALEILEQKFPRDDWRASVARGLLGCVLEKQKHFTAAEPLLLTGIQGMQRRDKYFHSRFSSYIPYLHESMQGLAHLYEMTDQLEMAAKLRDEAKAFEIRNRQGNSYNQAAAAQVVDKTNGTK